MFNFLKGGETVKGIAEGVGSLIGDVKTAITGRDPELEAKLAEAQVELNKLEAQSSSLFVAGWRPGLAWVCVCAMAYHYLLRPILSLVTDQLPMIEVGELYPLIIALLGLGVYRTTEKIKGVQNRH